MPVFINRRAALLAATSFCLITAASAAHSQDATTSSDKAKAPTPYRETAGGQSWVSEVLITGQRQGYGAPVAASGEFGGYVAAGRRLFNREPHPPFNAGSMQTAPPEVKAPMLKMMVEFKNKAEALARVSQARS